MQFVVLAVAEDFAAIFGLISGDIIVFVDLVDGTNVFIDHLKMIFLRILGFIKRDLELFSKPILDCIIILDFICLVKDIEI